MGRLDHNFAQNFRASSASTGIAGPQSATAARWAVATEFDGELEPEKNDTY